MSRISAVRSRTLQLKTCSRLRLCAGRQFVVEDDRVHVGLAAVVGEFIRLAFADERGGMGRSSFWMPSPMTSPPAVAASSEMLPNLGFGQHIIESPYILTIANMTLKILLLGPLLPIAPLMLRYFMTLIH